MESDRKRYYILVQDRVGYMIERRLLSFGAMKSTPTQLLKGELLEALPQTEQPNDSTRIALAGIDRKEIRLECRTEDVIRLTVEDSNLLLAISSEGLRYQTFIDRRRLDFGRQISHGSRVFVEVRGVSKKLHGTVCYIGELPYRHGTMFGVELVVSMFYVILLMREISICEMRWIRYKGINWQSKGRLWQNVLRWINGPILGGYSLILPYMAYMS